MARYEPAGPARSWAFTELIRSVVDRWAIKIRESCLLSVLRNTVLARLVTGELRGRTQDEEGKLGGRR